MRPQKDALREELRKEGVWVVFFGGTLCPTRVPIFSLSLLGTEVSTLAGNGRRDLGTTEPTIPQFPDVETKAQRGLVSCL